MPYFALAAAILAVGFEQIVQSRFGATGIVAFLLLTIGVKAKSPAIGGVGAVLLLLLMS
ncbi:MULTISPECIES: hypothetical protein [Streptomyces]|uniref:Uncharacterized protein n=2 Tax=Streptomyces TaxID=1883 RepID=A0A0B5F0R6_STRA4|nr:MULTISPECIES: hypothetical protein [Streptomyces]AJE84461.1 hypothetical protein SLNWT_4085 [Streptomyces albus]AOU78772.1 hypothetical protein SLNHY_4081 [Streptomyces albus]NKI44717.1 hypothetical protein [Streptomyces physcomitrii]